MPDITNNQNRPHLGTGLAFPLRANLQGSPQLSSDLRNIEESIGIILGTKLGERVYRPNFGSRLSELAFAPLNTQTILLIRLYVEEALTMWEPRIVLDGVYTEPDPIRGLIDITIEYHPKETHDYRSLVYPFYLQPSA
ncbi:MAG TPA: baseplate protein [Cyanobacteria bacterium UBA8803]|nr:baseplate protein [Cyanobacteria bacterium UBA9273]HBL59290.1 baseplate protein [Cyanobacteria bacterium UBA8803]